MPICIERWCDDKSMKRTQKSTRTTKAASTRRTSDALEILDRITGDDPGLRRLIAEAGLNREIAQMVYDARTEAGLTQAELAHIIGTKQSVISRLEDADYASHSLTILQRIAAALGRGLEVRFTGTPKRKRPASARAR
jgi:ribosome-binding protein aMBF1 (putative translation factor)